MTLDDPSPESAPGATPAPTSTPLPVQVYWRPGCGFCSSLLRRLDSLGLAHERHNIWEDEEARTFVRSVANGNETVPTVRIGDVALINPTPDDVLRQLASSAPVQVLDDHESSRAGPLARAADRWPGGGPRPR